MIYSDGIHIVTDGTVQDLHLYCSSIGLKRCWFHSGSRFAHYDIPKRQLKDFLEKHPEIKKVTSREIVEMLAPKGQFGEIDRALREGRMTIK